MFGLGVPELLFIMVLALLVFGPKRLPQIGRTLGRGMAEFRKASTELQRGINMDLEEPLARPSASPRPNRAEPTPKKADPDEEADSAEAPADPE